MVITIYVKTLDDRTHKFEIRNDTTVRQFKVRIGRKTRISPQKQRILYMGRELPNSIVLSTLGLNNKTVHVVDKFPPGVVANRNHGQQNNQRGRNRRRYTISEQTLDYLANEDRLWMEFQRYSELDLLFRNQIAGDNLLVDVDVPLTAPLELLALDDLLTRIVNLSPDYHNEDGTRQNEGNQENVIEDQSVSENTESVIQPPVPKRGFFTSVWYFFDGLNPY